MSSISNKTPLQVVTWLKKSAVSAVSRPRQLVADGAVASLLQLVGSPMGCVPLEGLPRGLTEKGEERTCAWMVVPFVCGWNNCLCIPSCVLAKHHARPDYLTGPPLRTHPTLTPLQPPRPYTSTRTHTRTISLSHTHTQHTISNAGTPRSALTRSRRSSC
jgi:hypothetical protein